MGNQEEEQGDGASFIILDYNEIVGIAVKVLTRTPAYRGKLFTYVKGRTVLQLRVILRAMRLPRKGGKSLVERFYSAYSTSADECGG